MTVAMSTRVQATRRRFGGLIALVGALLLMTGCGGAGERQRRPRRSRTPPVG
jgi:hypothetical protein